MYGLEHNTVKEISEIASEMEIPNRSRMRRQELLEAVRERMA